ncbi:MAG: hypothetical protein ABIT76_04485 [Chthoniobacterales bacterium]
MKLTAPLALSAALFLATLVNIFATEPLPLPTNQVSVELAAPPLDGTVSIGVFDASNKCIRVLSKSADSDSIPSALNGFLVVWDGQTADGTTAAKGTYEIRGVTVGDVSVQGEAYHFNDWINPDKPAISPTSTQFVRVLENGDFVVFQKLANGLNQLARYSAKGELQWSTATRMQPVDLVINGLKVCLASANYLQQFDLEKGAVSEPNKSLANIAAVASNSTGLLGIVDGKLVRFDPATLEPTPLADLPTGTKLLTSRGDIVLVSDGTSVFQKTGDHFDKIPLPALDSITHLTLGRDSHFWLTTQGASLTEFDLQGQPLRSLEPEGEDTFLTFDVNAADNQIALVSSKLDRQRFRILQWTDKPTADLSLWKTNLQKDSQPSRDFGIDLNILKPVASGKLPSEKTPAIALVDNPLTPGEKASLRVTCNSIGNELWLTTADGLPLILIAPELTSNRIALVRGKRAGSLRLYAAVPGAVAEFSLSGLQNMMQFTSEKITWPPGPRQAADESNVPSNDPAPTPETN